MLGRSACWAEWAEQASQCEPAACVRSSSLTRQPCEGAGAMPCPHVSVSCHAGLLDSFPDAPSMQADCSSLLPVYCFDPRDYGKSPQGYDRTGGWGATPELDQWPSGVGGTLAACRNCCLPYCTDPPSLLLFTHSPRPLRHPAAPALQAPSAPPSCRRRWRTCGPRCGPPAAS